MCTRLSILVPAPITVSSMLPRSIVVFAPISTSVVDEASSDMRDLLVSTVPEHVSKSIGSKPRTGVHDDTRADDRAAIGCHGRIDMTLVADTYAVADHGVCANCDLPLDEGRTPAPITAYGPMLALAPSCGSAPEHSRRVYAGLRVTGSIESRNERQQCVMRLGDDDTCPRRAGWIRPAPA